MNYVMKGVFESMEDDEVRIFHSGDVSHIVGGAKHGLRCIGDEPRLILTVWTPLCEDIMKKL